MYLKAPNVKSHCFYFPSSSRPCNFLTVSTKSCIRFRAPQNSNHVWAFKNQVPSLVDTIFSRQLTSATWKMSFLQHLLCVRYWYWFGERHLSPNQYQYLTRRFLHKVPRGSLWSPCQLPPRLLRHQESLLLPTRYVQFLLDHYIVYIAKRLVIFAPKFTEKSAFLNARLVRGILLTESIFLQMSTTRAIHAYSSDCFLC
jgi:hypothetical protein